MDNKVVGELLTAQLLFHQIRSYLRNTSSFPQFMTGVVKVIKAPHLALAVKLFSSLLSVIGDVRCSGLR
jgi:hypothetical protein